MQIVLTHRSRLALIRQMLICQTRTWHDYLLQRLFHIISPCHNPPPSRQNQVARSIHANYLLDTRTRYLNHHVLLLQHPLMSPLMPPLSPHVFLSSYGTPSGHLKTVSDSGRNTCIDPLMIPMRSFLWRTYIALIFPPSSLMTRGHARRIPRTMAANLLNFFCIGKTPEVRQSQTKKSIGLYTWFYLTPNFG